MKHFNKRVKVDSQVSCWDSFTHRYSRCG